MSVEENKQLVQRFHTELWSGNLAVVDELLSSDFHSAMGTPQGIKESVARSRSVVSDFQFQIEELIGEGDKVVMRWRTSGTYQGSPQALPDNSMPPAGKPFSCTGITINQVKDGKIVSDVYENSWTNMLLDMGYTLLPPTVS
jgi:predicted ester cyclase